MLSFFRSSPSGKRIPYASALTDGILSSAFFQFIMAMWTAFQALLVRVGLLESTCVLFSPANDGTDDWVRFNALLASEYGLGGLKRKIVFATGTFLALTPGVIPSGCRIVGNPFARVVSNMATAVPTDSPFGTLLPTAGAQTTLSSAGLLGSDSVSLVAPVDVSLLVRGKFVYIGNTVHPFAVSMYEIQSVTGAGPYTVKLDRCLARGRASGSVVKLYDSVNRDIVIEGNGMSISGVHRRAFELTMPWYCSVSGLRIDDVDGNSGLDIVGSMDIPSVGSTISDCSIEFATVVQYQPGFVIESGEKSTIEHCSTRGLFYGQSLYDCTLCKIIEPTSTGGQWALSVQAGVTDLTEGCVDCEVIGGSVSGAVNGVDIRNGSLRTKVIGTKAFRNSARGISVDGVNDASPGSSVTQGTQLVGVTTEYNTLGIGAVDDVIIRRLTTLYDTACLEPFAVCDIDQWNFTVDGSSVISCPLHNNARVVARGFRGSHSANYPITCTGSGRISIQNSKITGPAAGSVAYLAGNAVMSIENLETVGYTGTQFVLFSGAASVRIGRGNRLATAGTKYGAGLAVSRGTIALNGATPVTYSFPDLTSDDSVSVQLVTKAGTPAPFTWARSVGVGVVITGVALDTSTVEVTIGG